jgi:ATP-dependent Clp protease ATP-binding subunit ClpA
MLILDDFVRVLHSADHEAIIFRGPETNTLHLLHGVVRSPGSVGAELLRRSLDYERVEAWVIHTMTSRLYPGPQPSVAPPLTRAAKQAVREAIEESRLGGSGTLHSGHLLLGIAAEFDEPAGAQLRARGFDIPKARRLLAEMTLPAGAEVFRPADRGSSAAALDPQNEEEESSESLAVVADSAALPAALIAELMASLDALHRSWGGAGLEIDRDAVVSFPLSVAGR